MLKGVHDGVEELLNIHYDQEHHKILEWLTHIDFAPQQREYIGIRQAGTCLWFLTSDAYIHWLQFDNQTLFCPGPPGAGKTITCAAVINDIYTRSKNDISIGISYIYCDFRKQYEQKTQDLVASLLKQLTQRQTTMPEYIRNLYKKHVGVPKRPSLEELLDALRVVVSLYSKVFIIIDALDECQETDGCRKTFLSEMFKLQKAANINIFATSRFTPEIVHAFGQVTHFEINAKDEDVQAYLNSHMTRLPSFVLRHNDLQNEIKERLCQLSNGM